jgi:Protein of unknown function (DUF3667)
MSPEQGTAVASTAPASEAARSVVNDELVKPPPTCANCGAAVPGRFCGRCGQRLEHEQPSVLHFLREAIEDLTHADSRLWSTLGALLFKPGFLTREFVAGRRVRYLPPIRLYLVLSVLFFLIAAADPEPPQAVHFQHGSGTVELLSPESAALAAQPGETEQQREARVCSPDYDGPLRSFVVPFLTKGCRNFVADRGRTVAEAFWHNMPKALFVFLPLLALVMKAMYRRPNRYYVEHLLFFLHNHAFAFLVFGLLALVAYFVPSSIGNLLETVVWLYVLYYLFVSMQRVYEQSRWLTLAKFVVLFFAYVCGAALTLGLTAMYSVYSA